MPVPTRGAADSQPRSQLVRRPLHRRLARVATLDLGPLRAHRDFRVLYISQLISSFGGNLTTVALLYQIFVLTHSPLAVGVLGVVQFVPLLLLAFAGGAFADAIDRRRMVQVTELALAGLSAALVVNARLPEPQLWVLYVVGAFAAALDGLQRPALTAIIPRLVDADELVSAIALTKLRQSLGQIVGPALAGLVIASVGLPSAYGIDVATFVMSLVALRLMRAVPPPQNAAHVSLRSVLDGLRYVRSRPILLGTYLVDFVATFFAWPTAVFPALAVLYTRGQASFPAATALGLLYAAPAAGALLASVTSGWTQRVHRQGRGVLFAVLGWGLSITLLGLAPSLELALLCLVLMGGANLISGVFRGALSAQTTPDALRGRLAGIELICYTSGPILGDAEAGTVATLFSPNIAVVSGGILCLLGVSVLMLLLPTLRTYDAHDAHDAHEQSANCPSLTITE
jgi:MFS family permease